MARREKRRAPMQEVKSGSISCEVGLEGDHKGIKFPRRQITVLAAEAWLDAQADLADRFELEPLSWLVRRANLLVEGAELPRAKGGVVSIGPVELEVTGQTFPCRRMNEAHEGLFKALCPDWRGGVTCLVLKGGEVAVGDAVEILCSPPQVKIRLP